MATPRKTRPKADHDVERKLLRIPKYLMSALKIAAVRDHRSVNAEVVCALEFFLTRTENDKKREVMQ